MSVAVAEAPPCQRAKYVIDAVLKSVIDAVLVAVANIMHTPATVTAT